ncbi:MAG: hypothetical protein K0S30_2139 [Clostridia bacterium]|jgi:hypothetical protein|nr:hypothetical protein [Clostridia bacterium]
MLVLLNLKPIAISFLGVPKNYITAFKEILVLAYQPLQNKIQLFVLFLSHKNKSIAALVNKNIGI